MTEGEYIFHSNQAFLGPPKLTCLFVQLAPLTLALISRRRSKPSRILVTKMT